jgi:toxin ParE1/3/4
MRPRHDLIWSPASQEDLRDIWKYFARLASPEVAENLLTEIHVAADRIAENPLGSRERTELKRGIHGLPVHPYTIFYRIKNDTPEVVLPSDVHRLLLLICP